MDSYVQPRHGAGGIGGVPPGRGHARRLVGVGRHSFARIYRSGRGRQMLGDIEGEGQRFRGGGYASDGLIAIKLAQSVSGCLALFQRQYVGICMVTIDLCIILSNISFSFKIFTKLETPCRLIKYFSSIS